MELKREMVRVQVLESDLLIVLNGIETDYEVVPLFVCRSFNRTKWN